MGRKQTLVIATQNPKKERELRGLLGKVPFRVRGLSDFPGAPRVRESAHTFRGNALLKALSVARHTGQWVLADDSGLEVDALGGRPGIRTARFARAARGVSQDEANNRKLVRTLDSVPARRRGARFRCVIVLAGPGGSIHTTEGVLRGRIGEVARGRHGFGYDPIFIIPRYGKTLAQLGNGVKHRISHRAIAVRKAVRWLPGSTTLGNP